MEDDERGAQAAPTAVRAAASPRGCGAGVRARLWALRSPNLFRPEGPLFPFPSPSLIPFARLPLSQAIDISPLIMEEVMHKLHILDYVAGFCHAKDIQPFSRVYFAIPAPNIA
jgi:hypothetical protein